MSRNLITQKIIDAKLVAILRLKEESKIASTIETLVSSGIHILEITSNTPGYLTAIAQARKQFPEILVGAGTITNVNLAREVIDHGAQFLVTPNTQTEIIKVAHGRDIPVLMGGLTPTEITSAIEEGADIVKLFPAATMGLAYFKAIQGPLGGHPFFAVGGINEQNAQDWLQAGAGIGVGGSLVKGDASGMESTAKRLLEIINNL